MPQKNVIYQNPVVRSAELSARAIFGSTLRKGKTRRMGHHATTIHACSQKEEQEKREEEGDRTRDRGRPRDRRRAAGVGRDRRRAIRYSYPGQGNRSLLGKTRVAVEGPFHFPRGCRRRLLSGGRKPRERIEGRRWRENSPFCCSGLMEERKERREPRSRSMLQYQQYQSFLFSYEI